MQSATHRLWLYSWTTLKEMSDTFLHVPIPSNVQAERRKTALLLGGRGWWRVLIHKYLKPNEFQSTLKSKFLSLLIEMDCPFLMGKALSPLVFK